MTLDEIARLVDAAAAASAAGTTISLAGCTLVLRHGATTAPPEPTSAPPSPVLRAPAAGVFRPSHPALPTPAPGRLVAAGEAVAFLEIGPCLLPVVAPAACRPGPALVADGALVGFGTPLLPLETPA